MRKYFRFLLPLFLLIFNVIINYPKVSEKIKISENSQLIIGIVIIVFFGVYYFLDSFLPIQRYEEYIKKRHRILDSFAESLLKSYEQDGHQLRMNIMLAKPYILRSLEPSKKKPNVTALHLWGKLFKFIWTKNMVFHGQIQLILTTRQGCCGEAYQTGQISLADLTVQNPTRFNLNKDQIDMTKNIRFVLSCPLHKWDTKTQRIDSSKIIGVVNIDSIQSGDEIIIQNIGSLTDLTIRLKEFSKFCSLLF